MATGWRASMVACRMCVWVTAASMATVCSAAARDGPVRASSASTIVASPAMPVRVKSVSPPAFPITPIQTRITQTNASGAVNYTVQVGSSRYSSGYLQGASGFFVVALDRTTLAFLSSQLYLDGSNLPAMPLAIVTMPQSAMLIINSVGPPSQFPYSAYYAYGAMFESMGGTAAAALSVATSTFASTYSLIGNPGRSAGTGVEYSSHLNANTTGNIDGVLIPDNQGNFAYFSPDFVQVQTSAGANRDTTMIGTAAWQAPALPAGAVGGMHVVIARRDRLDRAGSDPDVVLLNQAYALNSSAMDSELARMAADFDTYAAGLADGSLLLVLASIGSTGAQYQNPYSTQDLMTVIDAAIAAGGTGDFLLYSPGTYALVGYAGAGALAPEARSWASPSSSGNITAVLRRDENGWFAPIAADAIGGLEYGLYAVAYQPPSPWPIADSGSGTCPAADGPCLAYQYISAMLRCGYYVNCMYADVRAVYADTNESLSSFQTTLTGMACPGDLVPPVQVGFTCATFAAVQAQVLTELKYAQAVLELYDNVNGVLVALVSNDGGKLQAAYNNVTSNIQASPSSNVTLDLLAAVRTAVMVGAPFVSAEFAPAMGIASAGLYLGMTLSNTPTGEHATSLVAEETELYGQISSQFLASQAAVGQMFGLVLSDWNKLSYVGLRVQEGAPGWGWESGASAMVETGMLAGQQLAYYQALMAARFQVVDFYGVSFSSPSDYSYQSDCGGRTCNCTKYVYAPPSWAYSRQANDIYMLATPSNHYPTSTLVSALQGLGVSMYDVFVNARGWSALRNVPPAGWPDFQKYGACPE